MRPMQIIDLIKDDLISRQAAIKALCENGVCETEKCNVIHCKDREAIERVPSIDPVKHGKWEKISDRNYKCSCCNAWWSVDRDSTIKDFKHCPDCGAQMSTEDPSHPFADSVMMGERSE